jgi:hypothetical protein
MAKNPFGDTPIGETNPFGDNPVNQTSPFEIPKEEKAGFGTNLYRTIGGALRDVVAGTLDVMAFKEKFSPVELTRAYAQAQASGDSSFSNILGTVLQQENPLNIAAKSIPKVEEPDYFGGSLARDVLGFSIPAAPISKLAAPLQAATLGQKLFKGAAVGSAAEQFAFSPYEERISNVIQAYPSLQNPITEFLQADPNDNEAQARLKMAVEGSAIGIPFDALLRAIGKGYSKIKTNQVTEDVDTFVGPKDTFVGPKNTFGDTPVAQSKAETVAPEVVTPKVETPKRGTKIPEILKKPVKPKVRTARDYFGKVSDDADTELKEIFEDYKGNIQRKFKVTSQEDPNAAIKSIDELDDVQTRMQEDGFYNQSETFAGETPSFRDDILEDLQNDTVHRDDQLLLSEWERKTEEAINLRKTLDDNNINYKGMSDEEVLTVYDDVINNRIPPVRDEVPLSAYADDIAIEESKITPKFIEEVNSTPPDFAGNINLNKIDSPNQVKNVIDEIAENNDAFIDARRGVVKFGSDGEELRALAKETGLTEDSLINRKSGSAFNAETAYAARVLNIESATNLTKLAKKSQGTDATPEDMFAFEEALNRHVAIQEQIAGITAEAGRTLRSFRETVASADVLKSRAIKDYIQAKGGGDKIEEMATFISNLDTPEQVAKFTKDAVKPKFKDKLQELWINSLLSSPSTHIVNVISNGIVAATRMPEYAVASLLGAGRKGSDKVSFTETGGRIYGSMYGFLDGIRAFKDALIDPKSVDDPLTKLELQRQNSISGIKGEVIRLPGRFLTAEDQLFKSVGYRQELWGQAIRKARSEGKGIKRAYEIMDDPAKNFPDIELASRDTARYQTFTNPLGPTGQAVQKIIQNNSWTRYIAPFVRTPVNIVKYAGQRTPLGVFAKSYKEAIKKGGAEADLARARVIVGSTAMASIAMLANEGLVTGRGPADYREKSILRETGWQPYSILVGDTYYAYNRFEPVGILFGLAADWTDIYKYTDKKLSEEEELDYMELASMLAASFSENITNKTFLTGVSDFINVMFNPDRYGESALLRFLSSFVPTVSYYVRKNDDPLIRDAQSLTDAIYNRIPGMSTELPARRNVFGEERRFQEGAAPDFLGNIGKTFSPVAKSTITNDVVFNELARLKITPPTPKRTIGGVDLTPRQYENLFKEMITLDTKNTIKNVIETPYYNNLIESDKVDIIKKIIQEDQERARKLTETKNPEIIEKQIKNLMKELSQ